LRSADAGTCLRIGVEQAGADGGEGGAALGAAVGRGADGGGREDARRRDAAGDALGEVARADEAQAERIRGGGLDGRRRHRREGSAAGFSQGSGDDDAWVVDLAGAPDPTRLYINKRRGKMVVPCRATWCVARPPSGPPAATFY
jgi:hypothetical protein